MQHNLQDWLEREGGTEGEFELRKPLKSYHQWLQENPQDFQPE